MAKGAKGRGSGRKPDGRGGKGGGSHPGGRSSKFREFASGRAALREREEAVPELSEDSSQPSFIADLQRMAAGDSETSMSEGRGVAGGAGELNDISDSGDAVLGGEGQRGRGDQGVQEDDSDVIVPMGSEPAEGRRSLASRLLSAPAVRREGFDESSDSEGVTRVSAGRSLQRPSGSRGSAAGPGQKLSLDEFISQATQSMEDRHAAAVLDLEGQVVGDRLDGVQTRVLSEQAKLDHEKKAVQRQVFSEAARWTDLVDLQSRPDVVVSFGQPRTRPRLPDKPVRPTEMDALLEAAQLSAPPRASGGPAPGIAGLQEQVISRGDARRQTAEIARLRAILASNEQKLRRWAKIKSKSFRKIHNREKRTQRRERDLQRIREEQERLDRGQIWGDNQYDGWASAGSGAGAEVGTAVGGEARDGEGASGGPSVRQTKEDEEVFRLARLARELGESNPYTDFANQLLDLQYKRGTMAGGDFAAAAEEGDSEERDAELEAQHLAETAAREGVDLEAAPASASRSDIRANYLQRRIREQKRLMEALEQGDEEPQPKGGRMILGDLGDLGGAGGAAGDPARPFDDGSDEFVPRRVSQARGQREQREQRKQREQRDPASTQAQAPAQRVAEVWDDASAPRAGEGQGEGRNSLGVRESTQGAPGAPGAPGLGLQRPNSSDMMRPAGRRISFAGQPENPFLSGEAAAAGPAHPEREDGAEISAQKLASSLDEVVGTPGPGEPRKGSDIMEAFGEGLPEDDFQFQKQALARDQLEAPETDDQQLPGWGSWVGAGISQKKRRELSFQHQARRAAAKAELDRQMQARRDASLSWVAISEAGEKEAVANYAGRGLYRTSDAEYAEYLSTAVSPEWQSVSAFRASIQPNRAIEKSRVISPAQTSARYVNHMQGERQIDKLRRCLSEQEKKMHKTTAAKQARKVKF